MKLTWGGLEYKANIETEIDTGKAKHPIIQVNFLHSVFIHSLCKQNYQYSTPFTFLTVCLCYRTICLSPAALNQEVSNRMTAGIKPMFALRLENIQHMATSFLVEVDVCLTLSLRSVIGSYRDIFTFTSQESKMPASQKRYFPFFVSQWFVAL